LGREEGTGISRMIALRRKQGIPDPEFSAHPDWFSVTFTEDPYAEERLLALGLSERQVKAVRYTKEKGAITYKTCRELTGISPQATLRELTDLCTREIFMKQGTTGRSTVYVLAKKITRREPVIIASCPRVKPVSFSWLTTEVIVQKSISNIEADYGKE